MDKTVVIFRVWKHEHAGGVIALFPEDVNESGSVQSFEHVGQHGPADYYGVMKRSRAAFPHEYAALKQELERPPYEYTLKVVKRRPH